MEADNARGKRSRIVLLTALGTQKKATQYALGSRLAAASLAPVALLDLLLEDGRPDHVLALVTEAAHAAVWDEFAAGVHEAISIKPEAVKIPDGDGENDLQHITERTAQAIPAGCELILDVTQGLRSIPFVMYAVTLYVTALRDVRVRAAYYGMYEHRGDIKPMIDLKPLLELPRWFHAIRVFRATGSVQALQQIVHDYEKQAPRGAVADIETNKRAGRLKKLHTALEGVSFAYESGLPLELGWFAAHAAKRLDNVLPEAVPGLPLARELEQELIGVFDAFRLTDEQCRGGGKWKHAVWPDDDELKRQARLVDAYLERAQLPNAIRLMREWVVSLGLKDTRDRQRSWLGRDQRLAVERRLGALAELARSDSLNDEQQRWGHFWSDLGELRNALAHGGMKEDEVKRSSGSFDRVETFWNDVKQSLAPPPAFGGGQGRLLVSPLGTRLGVLYSALNAAVPDRCLVLCSRQSQRSINEATDRAEFKGEVIPILIEDPHAGYDELENIEAQAQSTLLEADELVANLTGGTTMMGIAVQALFELGRDRLQRPARRLVLVDRRPPAEQDSEPWVASAHLWLDADSVGGDDAED